MAYNTIARFVTYASGFFNNRLLTYLNIGVEAAGSAYPHPELHKYNMSAANFISVDYPFEPST